MRVFLGLVLGPIAVVYGALLCLVHGPLRKSLVAFFAICVTLFTGMVLGLFGAGTAFLHLVVPDNNWFAVAEGAFVVLFGIFVFFFASIIFSILVAELLDTRVEGMFVMSAKRVSDNCSLTPDDGGSFLLSLLIRLGVILLLLGLAAIPGVGPVIALVAGILISTFFIAKDMRGLHARRLGTDEDFLDILPWLTFGAATAAVGFVPFVAIMAPAAMAAGGGWLSVRLDGSGPAAE